MTISSSALVHYVKITKNPVQFSNMCIETQWVGGGLEQFGEKEAASIIVTTLWATQRKRRRGANKRGIISIMVIISNTIFKLACNIQNKTENPSKDALQKAESFKKKCKFRKMTRLTRQIFPPNRIREGWCENCRTIKIANLQFRSVSLVSQIQSSVQGILAHLKVALFTILHNV